MRPFDTAVNVSPALAAYLKAAYTSSLRPHTHTAETARPAVAAANIHRMQHALADLHLHNARYNLERNNRQVCTLRPHTLVAQGRMHYCRKAAYTNGERPHALVA
jgi:hypothetical protein